MNYPAIFAEANAAAVAAVENAVLVYDENRGACGFAWVVIPGNDGLARWCRAQVKATPDRREARAYGDKGYPTGWQFWNPGNHGGQRVDIKEEGAKAFRDVLAKHGIRADVGSRLD